MSETYASLTREAVQPSPPVTGDPTRVAHLASDTLGALLAYAIPMVYQGPNVRMNDGLKIEHTLQGEYVRHNPALSCMDSAISSVEKTRHDRHKDVIKVRLHEIRSVRINDLKRVYI
jgi:hypothetical protein